MLAENEMEREWQGPRPRTGRPGGRPAGGRPRSQQPQQQWRRKVRQCHFCAEGMTGVDYKDAEALRRFLNERGKIRPRRQTGTCARHQRQLARAVKRARFLALLPFAAKHTYGG